MRARAALCWPTSPTKAAEDRLEDYCSCSCTCAHSTVSAGQVIAVSLCRIAWCKTPLKSRIRKPRNLLKILRKIARKHDDTNHFTDSTWRTLLNTISPNTCGESGEMFKHNKQSSSGHRRSTTIYDIAVSDGLCFFCALRCLHRKPITAVYASPELPAVSNTQSLRSRDVIETSNRNIVKNQ